MKKTSRYPNVPTAERDRYDLRRIASIINRPALTRIESASYGRDPGIDRYPDLRGRQYSRCWEIGTGFAMYPLAEVSYSVAWGHGAQVKEAK
jgi:hypothetical protein